MHTALRRPLRGPPIGICIYRRFVFACASPASPSQRPEVSMLEQVPWKSLGTTQRELTLSNTLPTGQSFRWYATEGDSFTGVIGERVVRSLLYLLD
jgi:hypothetical protein